MLATVLMAGAAMVCICLAVYFSGKERRLAEKMQTLIDEASKGKLKEDFKETRLSAIEASMRTFLMSQEVSVEKLKREREQLRTQISDISHQAVLPVSNIILYSQLLEEELKESREELSGQVLEELTAIREQAQTLEFLMEGLVKLSRLEKGILEVHGKRQPLAPVLSKVYNQFLLKAQDKDICLEMDQTGERAVFDEKWTVEALANIVDNAVKYAPKGGRIHIQTQTLSSFVRVDVTDTGPGILEEEQGKIFGRFYRSKDAASKPGVGIGLYIAREVMSAQNGYIKVTSKPGRGSTFSLYFLKEEVTKN